MIRRALSAWSLSALVLGSCASAPELIGRVVPPYPEPFTSDMGACVPDAAQRDVCGYTIATLNAPDGAVARIMATRLSHRVDGKPLYRVLDVRDAPPPVEGAIWAMDDCRVDGAPDPAAVGLVRYRDRGGWIESGKTVWAVRLDRARGKLVELDAETVTCLLPGS